MRYYSTNKDKLCGRTTRMENKEITLQQIINALFGMDKDDDDFEYENSIEKHKEQHDADMNNYFDNFNEK